MPLEPILSKVIEHENLLTRWFSHWPTDFDEQQALKLVGGIEVRLDNLYDMDDRYLYAVNICRSLLTELSVTVFKPTFLFHIEHKTAPRSRVRSYKGLFSQKQNQVQTEFQVSQTTTIIAGLMEIQIESIEESLKLLGDSSTSFFISPSIANGLTSEYLEQLFNFIMIDHTATVNYPRLIASECPKGAKLISVHFTTEDYIYFRIFVAKNQLPQLTMLIRERLQLLESKS